MFRTCVILVCGLGVAQAAFLAPRSSPSACPPAGLSQVTFEGLKWFQTVSAEVVPSGRNCVLTAVNPEPELEPVVFQRFLPLDHFLKAFRPQVNPLVDPQD